MISAKDYVRTRIPSDKTIVKFARDTVVSVKELEKIYIDVDGKEIQFIDWIRSISNGS